MDKQQTRVRFAPSPTGPQHIGGIRTALYNYLYAKKNNGTFILRIEDTDQKRYVKGSEEYLIKSLKWLNIMPDEGMNEEGPYGPYRQSERTEIYSKYIDHLIENDHAYYAFDTSEELNEMRERLKNAKIASPQYNNITRMSMKNSLTLPENKVQEKLKIGNPYVIRLKVPKKEIIKFKDAIRGWISVQSDVVDDKILIKSDGLPTYHFANVIDDHLMKISHVIRGEEWLSSTPIHILLYKYLNFNLPTFAHLPLILKPNGVGKLSKRDALKDDYPVFPMNWVDPEDGEIYAGFKEQGYLPEALINFLVLLGWSPGNNEEIFNVEELIKEFSLERIGKSGVKYDIKKAQWFNQEYIKQKPISELYDYLITKTPEFMDLYPKDKIEEICHLVKGRMTFMDDLIKEAKVFVVKPDKYHEKILSFQKIEPLNNKYIESSTNQENNKDVRMTMTFTEQILTHASKQIEKIDEYNITNTSKLLKEIMSDLNISPGKIFPIIRIAITGLSSGPDLSKILYILGKQEVILRIDQCLNFLVLENDKNK